MKPLLRLDLDALEAYWTPEFTSAPDGRVPATLDESRDIILSLITAHRVRSMNQIEERKHTMASATITVHLSHDEAYRLAKLLRSNQPDDEPGWPLASLLKDLYDVLGADEWRL